MTLNYVESSDLAVNRWHLPNDVDLRLKALCAKNSTTLIYVTRHLTC